MDITKTLRGPGGLRLELDRSRFVPNDPGADTPALLYYKGKTGTLTCAYNEGEVDGTPLSPKQREWIDSIYDEAEAFAYSTL